MDHDSYEIAIIGAGAAGLMLASQYDLQGAAGVLLEGSRTPGSKLLMSGGGHCNITHGGSIKDFLNAYGDAGPALRRCLYRHSNLELAKWLDDHGVALADEGGRALDPSAGPKSLDGAGRIFPASMKARDVLDAFMAAASENGWQLVTEAKVTGLGGPSACSGGADTDAEGCREITLDGGRTVHAKNVVIASGGMTYPETGSDGSMLEVLKALGVSITETRPALAPVYVEDYPYGDLAGISLAGVTVTVFGSDAACTCKGKAARVTGDILFTHEGFSGPAVLNVSGHAEAGEKIRLSYNRELAEFPKRMQRVLSDRARGASGDIKTTVLSALLDRDDFTVKAVDRRGMVTAGGISLDEIDMKTMELKRFDGLYAIGETLEAYGMTGGYNLQLCWSTAAAAADALRQSEDKG